MGDDIEQPYGELITTTVRVATWNVWGRYGPWRDRQEGIVQVLREAAPDVLVLVETWRDEDDQPRRLGEAIGLSHHAFAGDPGSGVAVLSRWPLSRTDEQPLGEDGLDGGGLALFARVDGPRGPLQVFGTALGWRLDHGLQRQRQVRELGSYVRRTADDEAPVVACGDFNADPDSDEIRMLTGRAAPSAPGLVFYDAWEVAGDGSPGHTWSNANPWTRPLLWPNRRIDYVFSAWPRRGGAGHPVHCELIGTEPAGAVLPSDHYGVLADLRY